jgi:hypothetical protein
MGWPSIPMLVFTDRIRFRSATWGKDGVSGRLASYGGWGRWVSCSVSTPTTSDQDKFHLTAHGREEMKVSHIVTLNNSSYPGLKVRDQLQWQETGYTLVVLGIEPAGDGRGRIWNLYCEYHPTA